MKVKSLSRVRLLATPWTVNPPGSSVHGIFQARVLEWGAIAFSVPWSRKWQPAPGESLDRGAPGRLQSLRHKESDMIEQLTFSLSFCHGLIGVCIDLIDLPSDGVLNTSTV